MQLAWRFTKDAYRVHCCNRSHARQITTWTGCKRHAVYHYPDGRIEEDVIVPKSRLKKACELAGLVNNQKISADSDSARNNAKSPLLKDNNLQEAENGISASER